MPIFRFTGEGVPECEDTGKGSFVVLHGDEPFFERDFPIGTLDGMSRFSACYRINACWMVPKIGSLCSEVPEETQFLLVKDPSRFCMLFPLVDKYTRCSLQGQDDGMLHLIAETGDEQTTVKDVLALFIIEGEDPFEMIDVASRAIVRRLATCSLREEKDIPRFTNLLGFCTYNAYGTDISHDRLLSTLEEFRRNGITLGFLLVDVGWQCDEGNYTTAFEADPTKFPDGIARTVREAKGSYGLREILVWHAYNGFWSGIKPGSLPDFDIEWKEHSISERIRKMMQRIETTGELDIATAGMNFYATNLIGEPNGFVKQDLFRLYFDFYSYLRKQGIDGTKLDAMAWIECFGQGRGGRVRMMQQLVSALEGSSLLNFHGEHINCSCCSNDFLYNALRSNVTRSSIDYFPEIPESHGLHVFTNAHTSFWMGRFILPDWDMFQSGGFGGEFHAMSRAISGGPVYCTDKPGTLRFDILRRLSTADGRIGRCIAPAQVTLDCLFVDPQKELTPIKVFSRNESGYVIGVFNCCFDRSTSLGVTGHASVDDVHGIEGQCFHVYSYRRGSLGVFRKGEFWSIDLETTDADIFTISPVKNGYAVVGMTDKYNPSGFVTTCTEQGRTLEIGLMEPGELSLYLCAPPVEVSEPCEYTSGLLVVRSTGCRVHIDLAEGE